MTTISATVVCDSIGERSPRLTTLQLRYPRIIHAEFMTHRVFSRNASSSRAIPVKRLIQDVIDDPFIPKYWGKNQKGMQASEECNEMLKVGRYAPWEYTRMTREEAWLLACNNAIQSAREFSDAGYHKQVVNRLLEPFSHINVLVTSTQWANFLHLRAHPDAEPHIQELAYCIDEALASSKPEVLHPGAFHLPYITDDDWSQYPQDVMGYSGREDGFTYDEALDHLLKVSVARSARVSYLTREGRKTLHGDDIQLYNDLVGSSPLHASPTEHQATPDTMDESGNWKNPMLGGNLGPGWIQYRKTLPGENYLDPID